MPKFAAELIKILAGVLIEKGLKPLFDLIKSEIEKQKTKRKNKKKIQKLKDSQNETDFDDGFDDMP
jgi:uncharacterized metal-binding protein